MDEPSGLSAPNCPRCLETLEAVVGAWRCDGCDVTVRQRDLDTPDAIRVDAGSLSALKISDGSWAVTIGGNAEASLGRIYPIGNWWAAFRFHGVMHNDYCYGEYAPPELIGLASTIPEALGRYHATA